MRAKQRQDLILVDQIEARIRLIRGERVMLDADLAELYGTTTKRLNEQVKRNPNRFPIDFMFRLTAEEAKTARSQPVAGNLRSQIATSSSVTHGGCRYLMEPPPTPRRRPIGFHARQEGK